MRRSVRRIAIGSATVLCLVGAAALNLAWQGLAGASAPSSGGSHSPKGNGTCSLIVNATSPHGRPSLMDHRGIGARPGAGGPSNLTVSIPPVVLIRPNGRRLVVTTNTGRRPQATDTFYVVAGGKAVLAGSAVRHEVLSNCLRVGPTRSAPESSSHQPPVHHALSASKHGHPGPKR